MGKIWLTNVQPLGGALCLRQGVEHQGHQPASQAY